MSPTITTPAMTQAGMILGTAAYMSPEQARGKTVDKRADIWAFGAVLYEMLTGRRAFDGEDVSDTLVAVLQREPDLDALPPSVPARAVRRCCVVPAEGSEAARCATSATCAWRWRARSRRPRPQTTASATSSASRGRLAWMAALAVAAVVVAIALAIPAVRHLRETPPPAPPETRVDIVTPATDQPTSFALSPDGRQIVFVASGDGASRLWLRSLATTTAQPLAGTEGATLSLLVARRPVRRLLRRGRAEAARPRRRRAADTGSGQSRWRRDVERGRRHRVCAEPRRPPDARVRHRGRGGGGDDARPAAVGPLAPQFLPDGRRFLFYALGAPDTAGIYLGALDGSAPTRLTPADSAGVYLPGPGRALAAVGAGGHARGPAAGRGAGGAHGRAGDAGRRGGGRWHLGRSAVSVAATGLVAYRTGAGSQRQLTWVDRSGTARGTVGDPDGTSLQSPRVPRRPSRGRGPHGAGQHGPLAAGRRPHEPVHVRCGCRPISRLVARRHPDRVPLEPDGCR